MIHKNERTHIRNHQEKWINIFLLDIFANILEVDICQLCLKSGAGLFPFRCVKSRIVIRNVLTVNQELYYDKSFEHYWPAAETHQTHNPKIESRILPLTSGERKRQKVSTMYDVISVRSFICLCFYLSVCLSVCMSGEEVCCLCCSILHEELYRYPQI